MVMLARPSAVSSFAPNPVSGLPPSFVKRSAGTSTLALVSGTSNRFQFDGSADTHPGHRASEARSTSGFDLMRCTSHWMVNDERHRKVVRDRPVSAHRALQTPNNDPRPDLFRHAGNIGNKSQPGHLFSQSKPKSCDPSDFDEGFRERFVFS